jgi:transcriptional regulator with XRE-family HTH domain
MVASWAITLAQAPSDQQDLLPYGNITDMDRTSDHTLTSIGPPPETAPTEPGHHPHHPGRGKPGFSASTLSRLETGLRRPTLEQLLPLARYYGVTLDSLVDAPHTGDPRIHLRPVACGDGSVVIPLTRRPGGIQAYKFILPAGNHTDEPDLRSHEGHDWAYVLNGHLRLILGDRGPAAPTRRRCRVRYPHPPLVRRDR